MTKTTEEFLFEGIVVNTNLPRPKPEDIGNWKFEDHNGRIFVAGKMPYKEAEKRAKKHFADMYKTNFLTIWLVGG